MSGNTNKKTVLIVDDDQFLLEMYSLKFHEAGFQVEVATDGREAKEKAIQLQPMVILLDVILPGVDGFEVLQNLRKGKGTEDTLIVMLTNLGQKDDTDRGMRLGADDYIVKAHFTPSEVVEKVKKLLAKKNK